MSAVKHTPGPWSTDTGGDVTRADGTTLLTREKPYDCTLDESFANAELAAAAPELLEALMQMVERISYYAELKEEGIPNIEDWAYTYNSGDMQRARAAIAKAIGGDA